MNDQTLRALIVDDSEDDVLLIIRELKKGGYNPVYERVETAAAMKKALHEKQWDIILCDYKMPKFNAPSAIALLKETKIDIPLIIISGAIGEETAVECMRLGAHDYIMKANLSRLCPAIARELEEAEVRNKQKQAEFQRKTALEALRQSEEKDRTILENIEDGYYETDLPGNYTFFNDSLRRIHGYTKEELMGMNYRQYTDKEYSKKLFETFNEVYKTGQPARGFGWQIIRKDGTKRYIEASVTLQKDSSGKPIGFRGITRDVTERKKAEEELRQSEEKYRTILKTIKEGYSEVDLAGNFTFVNDSICQFFGYSKEELIGMNYRQYTENKEDLEKLFQVFNKVFITGEPSKEIAWQVTRKDGTKRYTEQSATLKKDSSGKPIGFIGIVRDITERKQAEGKLLESERKLREAQEMAHLGHWIWDVRTGKVEWSEEVFKIFQLDPNSFTPQIDSIQDLSPWPENHERDKELIRKAMERHESGSYEQRFLRPDKSIGYYFSSYQGKYDDNGNLVSIVGTVQDITERKQAEESLRNSYRRLDDIIDFLPDATFVIDLDGKVTNWNMSMERMTMIPKEDMIGRGNYEYAIPFYGQPRPLLIDLALLPDDVFENRHYENVFRQGDNLYAESYVPLTYGGKGAFMWGIASRLRDASGNIIGAIESIRDITERKQAERELRENEERLRGITKNLPGVIIYQFYAKDNGEYEMNYASERMQDFFGLTTARKEKMFSVLLSRIPEEDRDEFLASIQEAVKTGTNWNYTGRVTIVSGELIWFQGMATPTRQDDRLVFDGILMNITERKLVDDELKRTLDSLKKAVGTTIQVLVSALESRDPYTAGHQTRSAHLACAIAAEMGLAQDKIDGIRMAGSIHDIGKLSIPAEILSKPTKLTNLEFSLIKEHSQSGYEMLKDVESPWPLAQIVHQHHERINGTGYPRNLKGEEIILEARIMGVADVVEAMASHRPYRPGLGIEVALEEIEKNKGILYDDAAADACLRIFREKGYKFP